MKTQKQVKTVQIIARISFKSDPRKVCYSVRSSDGQSQYTTCLFNGKACSCSCPSKKPCYHMTGVEAYEAEREAKPVEQVVPSKQEREAAPLAGASRGFRLMR